MGPRSRFPFQECSAGSDVILHRLVSERSQHRHVLEVRCARHIYTRLGGTRSQEMMVCWFLRSRLAWRRPVASKRASHAPSVRCHTGLSGVTAFQCKLQEWKVEVGNESS